MATGAKIGDDRRRGGKWFAITLRSSKQYRASFRPWYSLAPLPAGRREKWDWGFSRIERVAISIVNRRSKFSTPVDTIVDGPELMDRMPGYTIPNGQLEGLSAPEVLIP
jgi:hypothetical protein